MKQQQSRETIIPTENYSTSQLEGMMIPRVENLKHYVGTIEIPGIARGMDCLLESGQLLTCLHNVIDYNALKQGKAELIDFSKYEVSVYFVKNGEIYQYVIKDAPITGLSKLKAYGMRAMCFDYAFLNTNGNPLRDLGGGFKMEEAGNFMPAFATDPMQTIAISGPFLTASREGIQVNRFISLSNNNTTQSQHHQIAQLGNHPSAPGFSGMAIVEAARTNNSLHAIHSYRDNQGQQSGVKISEIIIAARSLVQVGSDQRLDSDVNRILHSWFEALYMATINSDKSVSKGRVITFDEAVKILQNGGNVLGDSKKKDLVPVANKAWGGYIEHKKAHSENELPHLHHPKHTPTQYPGHALYGFQEQQQRLAKEAKGAQEAEENRKRQLEATKARQEQKSKAEQVREEQEEKKKNKGGVGGRY